MVVLAHIKEQSRLSHGVFGKPRMMEALIEVGAGVGQRRVGGLMRENGTVVERTRKFKVTTDSNHIVKIAPKPLDRDFAAAGPNQKWAGEDHHFEPIDRARARRSVVNLAQAHRQKPTNIAVKRSNLVPPTDAGDIAESLPKATARFQGLGRTSKGMRRRPERVAIG